MTFICCQSTVNLQAASVTEESVSLNPHLTRQQGLECHQCRLIPYVWTVKLTGLPLLNPELTWS